MIRIRKENINTPQHWDELQTEGKKVSGYNPVRLNLLENLLPTSGKILDVGCYDGSYLKELTKSFPEREAYGTDFSERSVAAAMAACPGGRFITADANESQPFAAETFNATICMQTFEHIDNPHQCAKEIVRVTKKNGLIVVTVPNELAIQALEHVWSYTPKDLMDLFSDLRNPVVVIFDEGHNLALIGRK